MTIARALGSILAALTLGAVFPVAAAAPPAKAVDYADPATWLCKPGRPADVCGRSDQDATVLSANGSIRIERFHADPAAPVDCFYVYPTVSTDPGGNATMAVERAEIAVINQQFARFASVCRPYAPLYRQVTLAALHAAMAGHPTPADRDMPYADVKAAWDYYLAHDNHGRGVVLIGHSQGSVVLAKLVQEEIDGKPIQKRLVSVILAGYPLQVAVGKDAGGAFKSVPLCRAANQIGCVINFSSFRAVAPPSAASIFGASTGPGLEAACANPAALGGGSAPLHAYLGQGAEMVTASGLPQGPWTDPVKPIATPFVEVPGLLSAECRHDNGHNYLAVTLHPTPGSVRTNEIVGDLVIGGHLIKDWGLHRIDMNLTMGDLVDVVGAEGKAYRAASR